MALQIPEPQAGRARGHSSPDGVLIVDKTEGPTSHDVVTLARRALGVSRIGHTGTLDPMATGVLPLVIGRATRLAQFLTASDKTYEATIAFGRTTDTYDATGTVIATSDRRPTRDAARSRRSSKFRGTLRADAAGVFREEHRRRALVRSRAQGADGGRRTRPKAVTVTVKRLEVLAFDGETARLEMQVTAGFYVRSLAHDLGDALGCGARPVGAAPDAVRRVRARTPRSRWPTSCKPAARSLAGRMIPLSALLPDSRR